MSFSANLPANLSRAFITAYCLLLIPALFSYAPGYNYFLELNGRGHLVPWLEALLWFTVSILFLCAWSFKTFWIPLAALITFSIREVLVSPTFHPYSTNIAFAVLLIFVLTKNPLRPVQATVAMYYLTSGLSKLVWGGTAWLSGATLKYYFIEAALYKPNDPVIMAINSAAITKPFIFQFAAMGVLLWEILFFTALLRRYTAWFFVTSGLIFHWIIWQLLGPNFFFFLLPAYLAFVPELFSENLLYRFLKRSDG